MRLTETMPNHLYDKAVTPCLSKIGFYQAVIKGNSWNDTWSLTYLYYTTNNA